MFFCEDYDHASDFIKKLHIKFCDIELSKQCYMLNRTVHFLESKTELKAGVEFVSVLTKESQIKVFLFQLVNGV